MSRRRRDWIDFALEDWARQRRRIVGVDQPLTAREFVGAVRCSIGNRRGLHGRGSGTTQQYPEIYTGPMPRAVNAVYWASCPELKWILDLHYVIPGRADEKSEAVGLSLSTYFRRVRSARLFVACQLQA